MDKIYTKKILETAGIPQVKSLYVKNRYDGKLVVVNKQFDEIEDIEKTVEEELGFPCFIKASRSGSSVGCYRCDHKEDLMTKLIEASKYDRHIVVEECVDCIELETAVLGNDDPIVSRVGQIMPHALRVFKAVDGHGLSRVDFFLDKKSNQIYLNEINTLPGFTKISMYPQLMNDFGISYSELLDRVIQLAFDK